MAQRKYQPTIKEARNEYWDAIAQWEDVRTDSLATYWQLRDAASRVSVAREEWYRAAARAQSSTTPYAARLAAAKVNVAKELDEHTAMFSDDHSERF